MTYSPSVLNKFDFTNAVTYQQLLDLLQKDIISDNLTDQLKSIDFVKEWFVLHPDFVTQQPEKYAEIQRRLHELAWLALPGIESETVLELFQQQLITLFNLQAHYELSETDFGIIYKEVLTERVRKHLVGILLFTERDAFKAKLVTVLQQNQEIITTAEHYSDIKAIPSTLQNWLAEYDRYMGKKFSSFRQSSWFVKNDNVKRLSGLEKDRLRTLINLYERLKISSFTPAGVEEVVPYEDATGIGVLRYGEVEYYDPKVLAEGKRFVKNHQQLLLDMGHSQAEVDELTGARPPVAQLTPKPISTTTVVAGPDIAATKGPDHFADQDQAEIEAHKALVADLAGTTGNATGSYLAKVDAIKQALKLQFATPELEKKFTDLLVSVLRGLRDLMEFQSYLEDLKYSTVSITAIIAAVKAALPKVVKQPANEMDATKQYIAKQGRVADSAVNPIHELGLRTSRQDELGQPTPSTKPTFLPKLRRSRSPKKPLIDDVKIQQSMVMGPVDELRAMDIIEFRRLAADPISAAIKLRDKVQLLGEESLLTQAEGIKAFRQSPLQQLYLDIGNQSIATGQSVADVIADSSAHGKTALTMAEFTAVADLNKQMRF